MLMKMVLRHPGGVKAQAFGVNDLLGGKPVALGRGRGVEQAGEECKTLEFGCSGSFGDPMSRTASASTALRCACFGAVIALQRSRVVAHRPGWSLSLARAENRTGVAEAAHVCLFSLPLLLSGIGAAVSCRLSQEGPSDG